MRLAGRDLIVLHVAPTGLSFLDEILTQAGPLPATQRVDGELITLGRIYVASHDHHLLLEPGHVRVTWGPKENRFRPAAKTSSATGSATQVILAGKCSFITL